MKQRLITGVVAGVLFLGVLWAGGYLYGAVLLALAVLSIHELAAMYGFKPLQAPALLGYLGTAVLAVPWTERVLPAPDRLIWWLTAAWLLLTVASKNRVSFPQVSVMIAGTLYIGYGFHYMWAVRTLEHGLFWCLLVFVCLWANDSGAYFSGRLLGRTPLWPSISPKKTVEGSVGGVLLAVAAASLFAAIEPAVLAYGKAALMGAGIAVAGQLGDLIESACKRTAGVKDSGKLLPGHGGILDRADSWIVAFPFVFFLFFPQ